MTKPSIFSAVPFGQTAKDALEQIPSEAQFLSDIVRIHQKIKNIQQAKVDELKTKIAQDICGHLIVLLPQEYQAVFYKNGRLFDAVKTHMIFDYESSASEDMNHNPKVIGVKFGELSFLKIPVIEMTELDLKTFVMDVNASWKSGDNVLAVVYEIKNDDINNVKLQLLIK